MDLEEEELVSQCCMWFTMQGSASQVGQFVSVLAAGRDADRSRPVVVHVAQFVGQQLEELRRPIELVADNVEVAGSDGSVPH